MMGRILRPLILGLATLLLAGPAAAQEASGSRIAAQFARPSLEALVSSADEAEAAISGLCGALSLEALASARTAFATMVTDWGRVTVLRFGPLADEHRFERIFFWPDPRGIALRQVQGLLAEEDDSATSPETLAEKSAALQGLPALEFALFGTGSEDLATEAESFRCRYAAAIAGNVGNLAGEVLAGWQNGTAFARSFTAPDADSDPYRDQDEVDGEIIKALSTVFQFVRAAEILPALGDSVDDARGKRAPLWRSGLTFELIVAQAKGARDFLTAAGYVESLPEERNWVPGSIAFELATTINILSGIDTAPVNAFEDEDARGKITVADLALDHAGHLTSEQLAAALDLIMGFNALDGD